MFSKLACFDRPCVACGL